MVKQIRQQWQNLPWKVLGQLGWGMVIVMATLFWWGINNIGGLHSNVAQMDARLLNIEKAMHTIQYVRDTTLRNEVRIGGLEQRFGKLEARIDNVETRLSRRW